MDNHSAARGGKGRVIRRAGGMPWRKESDPRVCQVLATLHRLIKEGTASGDKGSILIEPLPYWRDGLGNFEAARTVKIDLTKATMKG
jgi:hypothetical protein